MLKRRIIPIQLLLGERLVKTRGFNDPRDVGDPIKSSKVYSDQDADELILLHIDREERNIYKLAATVKSISAVCFVPLTVGGGIRHLEDVEILFKAGADKVLVNSTAYSNPRLLSEIVQRYGRQALVVGVDIRDEKNGYVLYSDSGRKQEFVSLSDHISNVIEMGAGELMIQSIDRDGLMCGYNLSLLKQVITCCDLPVIAAAGAGNFLHIKEVFDLGVDAAGCGSLFNFGDNNPLRAKSYLKNYGIPLKLV